MSIKAFIFILCGVFFSATAWAEEAIVLSPIIHYSDILYQYGSATTTKESATILQLGLGYQWSSNLYLGLHHLNDTRNQEIITEASGVKTVTASDKNLRTGTGVTFGYHANSGLMLDASFLFYNVHSRSGTTVLYGGNGAVFDLAYRFKLGSSFALGPQVSMTSLQYKKQKVDGVTSSLSGTWREQYVLPYLAMWLYF